VRALEGGDELGMEEGGLWVFELWGDVSGGSEVLLDGKAWKGLYKEDGSGSRMKGKEEGKEKERRQGQPHNRKRWKKSRGRTGSWSIAHGIKHGTSDLSPKMWGNELEKEGAAWMAGKWDLPMLSLKENKGRKANEDQLELRQGKEGASVRVVEAKSRFRLVVRQLPWDLDDVSVKGTSGTSKRELVSRPDHARWREGKKKGKNEPNVIQIRKDEGFLELDAAGDDVLCVVKGESVGLLEGERLALLLEEELLVVWIGC
jgi:hypothetical protein